MHINYEANALYIKAFIVTTMHEIFKQLNQGDF